MVEQADKLSAAVPVMRELGFDDYADQLFVVALGLRRKAAQIG